MSDRALEGTVLLDALTLLTAPLWLAGLLWLVIGGAWGDWRERG